MCNFFQNSFIRLLEYCVHIEFAVDCAGLSVLNWIEISTFSVSLNLSMNQACNLQ